jgi:hypothetical protein
MRLTPRFSYMLRTVPSPGLVLLKVIQSHYGFSLMSHATMLAARSSSKLYTA